MKLHGPIAFVEIYGSNGPCRFVGGSVSRLGIPYAWALPLLTTCRHLPRPAHQSGTFCNLRPYGPSCFVAHTPNLLDVPALAARKLTRRRFGELSRNSSRVAALAGCWRLRSVVVGGSGAPRNWTRLSQIRKKQMKEKPVRQKRVTRGHKASRPEGAESIFR